jgi:hypothetical protein
MKKSNKSRKPKKNLRKTQKKYINTIGGQTFSRGNVKLLYGSKDVKCTNCSSNNYNEVIGTLGKSKIRTMAGDLIFGDSNKDIDNTSIIAYFCSTCGICQIIRNDTKLKITATKI